MTENYKARLGKDPGVLSLYHGRIVFRGFETCWNWVKFTTHFVALEYEVPYNQSRLDCLLFGKGANNISNVVLIELKQWSNVKALAEEGNFVETYTGGRERIVPHPSQQVKGIIIICKDLLKNLRKNRLSHFTVVPIAITTQERKEGLHNPVYKDLIAEFPLFTKEDTKLLASGSWNYLKTVPA